MRIDNITKITKVLKDSAIESRLKGACSDCCGYIKNCDNCGQKIEILNGKPLDYHAGSLHRCGRGRV